MIPASKTNAPILFNSFKHHIQWVHDLVQNYTDADLGALIREFQKGNNLFCDYYFGQKNISDVIQGATEYLKDRNVFEKDRFLRWLQKSSGKYRNFQLDDGSEWTLLVAEQDQYFVHLHPARYSIYTIRVRFLALKTAILLKLFCNSVEPDVQTLNWIRTEYLQASPLKINSSFSHIKKVLNLFENTSVLSSEK